MSTSPATDDVGPQTVRVEIVAGTGAEPGYVLEHASQFATDAGFSVAAQTVDNVETLRDRIRDSTSDFLIVAAHGSTTEAGPSSGIVTGGGFLSNARILEAVRESGAKQIFFAACGLDLPDEVGNRIVHSFDWDVDMKIAAVSAIATLPSALAPQDAAKLETKAVAAVQRIGDPEELYARLLMPMDTLAAPSQYDDVCNTAYYCNPYSEWTEPSLCARNGWTRTACQGTNNEWIVNYNRQREWYARQQIEQESQVGGFLESVFDRTFASMIYDLGLVQYDYDDDHFGKHWVHIYIIRFPDCWTIWGAKDLVLPGLSQFVNAVDKIPGIDVEADAMAVQLCGRLYFGFLDEDKDGVADSSQTKRGGSLTVMLGSDVTFGLTFIHQSLKIKGFAGVITTITPTLSEEADGSHTLNLNVRGTIGAFIRLFLIRGAAGFEAFNKNFAWQINPSELQQAQSGDVLDIEGIRGAVQELWRTQTLTRANLNWILQDEQTNKDLSSALGVDVASLQPGAVIDVGNPAVCHALYGDDAACPQTLLGPGLPYESDAEASGEPQCHELETGDPGVGLSGQATICVTEEYVSAGTGGWGVGLTDWLDERTNGVVGPHLLTAVDECYNLGVSNYYCTAVRNIVDIHGIATERAEGALRAAALTVDIKRSSSAVFVDFCLENVACPAGSVGVAAADTEALSLNGLPVRVMSVVEALDEKLAFFIEFLNLGGIADDLDCLTDDIGGAAC